MFLWMRDCGLHRCGGMARGRQFQLDNCTAAIGIARRNLPTVFFDQSVTNAQPQTGSLADALGGIERFEDAVRLLDTGPRILE